VDLNKYRQLFVDEATDHLAEMVRALSVLESESGDPAEAVDTLFRMTHSIKGMAASLDYLSVSTLAHKLEDWLEPMRKAGSVPETAFGLLYESVQAMEEMVAVVERTGDPPPPRDDLIRRILEPPMPAPRAQEVRESAKKTRTCGAIRSRVASGSEPRRSTAFSLP